MKSSQLEQSLKLKHSELEQLKYTHGRVLKDIENIVNSQLAQKGNELIHELDLANRQLYEIKGNVKHLEEQVRRTVFSEYKKTLEEKELKLTELRESFKQYRIELSRNIQMHIEQCKEEHHLSTGLPLQEHSAEDLLQLQQFIQRMQILHRWRALTTKRGFEQTIERLEENSNDNKVLWSQLCESQRREALLKKELSHTQQLLVSAEKLVDKLQLQLETMNGERLRLQHFKSCKGKRLDYLEGKLKQYSAFECVDQQKVINEMLTQNKLLCQLKSAEHIQGRQFANVYSGYKREISGLKRKLKQETRMKREAFEQVGTAREEKEGALLKHRCCSEENQALKTEIEVYKREFTKKRETMKFPGIRSSSRLAKSVTPH